jgi:hypothetical protein
MRLCIVDDIHLGGIFASLLETYTQGFRARFVPIPRVPHSTDLDVAYSILSGSSMQYSNPQIGPQATTGFQNNLSDESALAAIDSEGFDNSWFALPFESSMAPFGDDFTQPQGIFDGGLDFIWSWY